MFDEPKVRDTRWRLPRNAGTSWIAGREIGIAGQVARHAGCKADEWDVRGTGAMHAIGCPLKEITI